MVVSPGGMEQTLQFSAGVPKPLPARDAIDKRFSMGKNETG